jgi:hypothetical protein
MQIRYVIFFSTTLNQKFQQLISIISSLLVSLNNQSLWVKGFADDIAIVTHGKFLSTVCELMQKALFIVQNWCRGVGLSVNADKTSMVLFTNNWKLVGFKKPILFGTELQMQNQVKYLGVILDEKLNWNRMQKATEGCVLDIHLSGDGSY